MPATADFDAIPRSPARARRRPRSILRALRRDQDGATAVEFGLLALPFLALLFAILETSLMFWSTQVLETAVANASRTIYTGQFQSANDQAAPEIAAKFKTAFCSHVKALIPCDSPAVHVDVRVFQPGTSPPAVITADGQVNAAAFGYQATNGNDIVLVRVAVEYPVIVPLLGANRANLANGKRLIMASATFRNEPF